MLYIIPHFQKTWPRFSRIHSKQKFITKALRGGRLLTLSSETTRSLRLYSRDTSKETRERKKTRSRKKKRTINECRGSNSITLCYGKFVSFSSFPRETRRRNNHRESRTRPCNDFSSACNGNIKP